ncbi:MAG: glycerophosphodiester phosphodiesterase family protein [Acetatifactor sp.]|nr:glycerophosphodiester phosphodiesterase family protein [Acetatifactor sp.]
MNLLMIPLTGLPALAVLYLLMIMPRMVGKPDTAPFQKWLYAHRGLHSNEPAQRGEDMAPENSLRAFRRAVEAGFGIEMDVQMTKDHIPVVFHDFTLKRICGREGKVCDYTYEELQQFPLCGSDQRIPKFKDVLSCVDGKVPLIVELKIEAADLSVCPAADGLLAEYKGMYCIESFNPLGLFWYRMHRRRVVRGQLAEAFLRDKKFSGILYFVLQNLVFNWLTKPDFIAYNHSHYDMLSRRLCRKLYHNMAAAWTIKSQEQLEQARKHFDLFIFDSFVPSC